MGGTGPRVVLSVITVINSNFWKNSKGQFTSGNANERRNEKETTLEVQMLKTQWI